MKEDQHGLADAGSCCVPLPKAPCLEEVGIALSTVHTLQGGGSGETESRTVAPRDRMSHTASLEAPVTPLSVKKKKLAFLFFSAMKCSNEMSSRATKTRSVWIRLFLGDLSPYLRVMNRFRILFNYPSHPQEWIP